eukprot:4760151-Amphidinium_carterae.1
MSKRIQRNENDSKGSENDRKEIENHTQRSENDRKEIENQRSKMTIRGVRISGVRMSDSKG